MSDTPRTNKKRAEWGMLCECSDNPIDLARTLERELNTWQSVADSLAQELTDNLAPGLPSSALDAYEKLKTPLGNKPPSDSESQADHSRSDTTLK